MYMSKNLFNTFNLFIYIKNPSNTCKHEWKKEKKKDSILHPTLDEWYKMNEIWGL